MTRTTVSFLLCSALVLGCGRSQTAKRTEQNYQVVEEGQASGVTSTINAPGETPPPLTDTAVDTTTNFTLPDNPAPLGSQPPATIAGTLPQRVPVSTQPPPMMSNSVPITTDTVPSQTQQPRRRPTPPPQQQPPTETTSTEAPPPATDTAAPPPKTDTTQTRQKTDTTKTETAPPPTDTTKTDTTSTEKPPV
jgi:hypothetical protein